MSIRLTLAGIILLGIYGAAHWANGLGMPTVPASLQMKTQDLPMTLGEWKGETVTLDPEVFKHTGAEMATERMYRDLRGRAVALHLAVFDKPGGLSGLPHPPEQCYGSSNYQIEDPKTVSLDGGGTTGNVARLWPAVRNGQTFYVLHWYQIDGRAYCTGDQQRRLLLETRGHDMRSPVIKVILQTTAVNGVEAETSLLSLAAEVRKWLREFH